ncbi:SubName: Full=Uncharacterized protein {ECO:0000313/EMBL:CCA77253.1} [Serendipita indica DSM 11827]|nr:SubName: Full=Uncharacterized protein {ECO:0000313/EMBL:CCA77253.1} [Serendipita indica DSM 11827]
MSRLGMLAWGAVSDPCVTSSYGHHMDMEIDRDAEGREENYYKDPERRMRAIALLAQIKRHNEEIVKAFRKWDGYERTLKRFVSEVSAGGLLQAHKESQSNEAKNA